VTAAVWVAVGTLAMALVTALGSRLPFAHVLPDATVIIVVFLALRRGAVECLAVALALGYFAGRQALAPVGLHEAALALTLLTVYFAAGNIAGSGPAFFAFACGGAVMLYHLLVFVIATLNGSEAGFASLSAAALVPAALFTAVVAWLCHGPMLRLERRLRPEEHEALSWR
jgi:hypothetical protein